MPFFLHPKKLQLGERVFLEQKEAEHVLDTRRISLGEKFLLQDIAGKRFQVVLEEVEGRGKNRKTWVSVVKPWPVPPAPKERVSLLQAWLKPKAMDWVITKATELGVDSIEVFPSSFSAVKNNSAFQEKQLLRWEKLAWEACKQCERGTPPSLFVHAGFKEALETSEVKGGWLLDPLQGAPVRGFLSSSVPCLVVGPEGGLTPEEGQLALHYGLQAVSLGPYWLKAETAALAALSLAVLGVG